MIIVKILSTYQNVCIAPRSIFGNLNGLQIFMIIFFSFYAKFSYLHFLYTYIYVWVWRVIYLLECLCCSKQCIRKLEWFIYIYIYIYIYNTTLSVQLIRHFSLISACWLGKSHEKGWDCGIHWLHLSGEVRPPNKCPEYDIKPSDGEAPALEL